MNNRVMRDGPVTDSMSEGLLEELLRRITNVTGVVAAVVTTTEQIIDNTWGGSDTVSIVDEEKSSNAASSSPPMDYRLRQAMATLERYAENAQLSALEIKRRI